MVVGWQVSTSLRTDLALDALEYGCGRGSGPAATSPAWSITPTVKSNTELIRYTERLAEAEAVASVGSKGDNYDNAMAEAFNSLFKAECIRNPAMRPKGGWKSVGDVEIAVAEYVDWFNHRRLHGEDQDPPPTKTLGGRPLGLARTSGTTLKPRPQQGPDPSNRASTKPGAIHIRLRGCRRGRQDRPPGVTTGCRGKALSEGVRL